MERQRINKGERRNPYRGVGGFPASGPVFGAMIGAASVYDMANQFDLYDNGGLDICFMGALDDFLNEKYLKSHSEGDSMTRIIVFAYIFE